MEKCFAYLRVSDSSQKKGDGFTRQEKAVRTYAHANKMQIIQIFKEDMTGTEFDRPILAELLVSLEQNGHGVKTVLIEKLDRLARDLMVQESIVKDFQSKRFNLVSAMEGPDLCSNEPTRKLIRQVFGAVAEYEKRMLVAKLKAAKDRIRTKTGKCEGRKGYTESEKGKMIIQRIYELNRKPKYKKKLTLQQIADQLNQEKITTLDGNQWSLFRVQQILKPYKHTH